MIEQTSPPFSTHVKHRQRSGLRLGSRLRGNPFTPQHARRVAWKLLMTRRQILGFYGLENGTNQSALLTVDLFRTFLFSKPSNVHLFHPAFRLGSVHIDFPVRWRAWRRREHSGVQSGECWPGASGLGTLAAASRPLRSGLGEGRVHCIKKDPCTPFLLVWFPLEPGGWDFHICVFPSFTFKSHSKSSALFNYIRRCERQGPSRKQNLSQMVCLEVGKFFFCEGSDRKYFWLCRSRAVSVTTGCRQ